MPVSERVRAKCRLFLEPGDELRHVFPAVLVGVPPRGRVWRVLVMVSDRYVMVLFCSRWRVLKPLSVWQKHPRRTRLGPVEVHPSLGPVFTLGTLTMKIREEHVPAARAADLELTWRDLPAPDPPADFSAADPPGFSVDEGQFSGDQPPG